MIAIPAWLWAAFTVAASAAQTARNAMQRDLIEKLGMAGATHVRFIFAFPFALIFLGVLWSVSDLPIPLPSQKTLLWATFAPAAQTAATAFMLAAMRGRSFVVAIAFTKTEPLIIALVSVIVLNEIPSPPVAAAILIATSGVMLMSWPNSRPKTDGELNSGWTPALMGLGAGTCFALSATSYRVAILSLETPSFFHAATTTLALGLGIQTAAILLWLSWRDRQTLAAIAAHWRPSGLAGFMGAIASLFWFLAFAISTAAKVRTLALIEVPFAQIVSGKIKQKVSLREYAGMGLVIAGIILLLNS
jgi:drug/metabolite transporter (DMT)-like permease